MASSIVDKETNMRVRSGHPTFVCWLALASCAETAPAIQQPPPPHASLDSTNILPAAAPIEKQAAEEEAALKRAEDESCMKAMSDARAVRVDPTSTEQTATRAGEAWEKARSTCRLQWSTARKVEYEAAQHAIEGNSAARARSRCYASFDAARGFGVNSGSDAVTAERAEDAWSTARTMCSDSWSAGYEEVYQSAHTTIEKVRCAKSLVGARDAIHTADANAATTEVASAHEHCHAPKQQAELALLDKKATELMTAHKRRVAKMEEANLSEQERCGDGEMVRFILNIRTGFNPARSKGCAFRVAGMVVLSTTADGWSIVGAPPQPLAAMRSVEPLMNGAIVLNRQARFLGMESFTTVEGTVSVLPTFALLK